MPKKQFSDGTEFGAKELAIAVAAGATIGTAIFVVKEKLSNMYWKNYRKRYNH